jgi:putative Mn2+ efflux pump MntP
MQNRRSRRSPTRLGANVDDIANVRAMPVYGHGAVLVATVAAVGVLHTIVPDHWGPIVVVARARGWTLAQTARAAALAGLGHVTSTLVLGAVIWLAGAALATRYAHVVSIVSALALIGFGLWIAYGGWQEARGHGHEHHAHEEHQRTALLLILGSSPMIEGLPAFFSASTLGVGLLGVMSIVFAAATIVTYVALSVAGARSLQRSSLGRFEQYGELLSGLVVALVGVYALVTS